MCCERYAIGSYPNVLFNVIQSHIFFTILLWGPSGFFGRKGFANKFTFKPFKTVFSDCLRVFRLEEQLSIFDINTWDTSFFVQFQIFPKIQAEVDAQLPSHLHC
jgi:hypothetical protein